MDMDVLVTLIFTCYIKMFAAVPGMKFNKNAPATLPCTDITTATSRSKLECGAECLRNKRCVSFTYNAGSCYQFGNSCGQFLPASASACGVKTAPGYKYDATVRKCYKIHTASDTLFAAALATCQHDDGHLLRVHSEDVQRWIRQQLIDLDSDAVFIDGMYSKSRMEWVSYDGSKMQYSKWKPGQPPVDTEGTRIAICRGDPASSCNVMWKMQDVATNSKKGYVCEIDV